MKPYKVSKPLTGLVIALFKRKTDVPVEMDKRMDGTTTTKSM